MATVAALLLVSGIASASAASSSDSAAYNQDKPASLATSKNGNAFFAFGPPALTGIAAAALSAPKDTMTGNCTMGEGKRERERERETGGKEREKGTRATSSKKMKEEDDDPHSKNGNNSKKPQKGALVDKVDTILSAKYDPETVAAWRRLVTGKVR